MAPFPLGLREAMLESTLYQKFRQARALMCYPPLEPYPEMGTLLWMPAQGMGDPRAEGYSICSASRKEFLEKIFPQRVPMESDSTTLQDQQDRDYQSRTEPTSQVRAGKAPPPPQLVAQDSCVLPGHAVPTLSTVTSFYLQPHNYYMDEPYSFWVDKYPVSPPWHPALPAAGGRGC